MAERKQSQLATQEQCTSIASPKQLMEFSNAIKQIIVENKLYSDIKGKNYINVEGWQMAGAFLGMIPIIQESVKCDDCEKGEIKYRAKVNIYQNDRIVGAGFASCSNKEPTKKSFQEYAIESMAQTRAIGKAYRSIIGYLLKMAGYETTPAEEMDEVEIVVEEEKPKPKANPKKSKEDLHNANLDYIRKLWAETIEAGVPKERLEDVNKKYGGNPTECSEEELSHIALEYQELRDAALAAKNNVMSVQG